MVDPSTIQGLIDTLPGGIPPGTRGHRIHSQTYKAIFQDLLDLLGGSSTGQFINVMDYGAVGNGVSDDSAPINAAQSALVARGGGTLWYPDGKTFLIGAASVDLRSDVLHACSFPGSAWLKLADGANKNVMDHAAGGQKNVGILNLGIDGNSTHQTAGYGASLVTVTNGIVSGVKFKDTYHRAVNVFEGSGISVRNCTFDNIGQTGSDPEDFACYADGTVGFDVIENRFSAVNGAAIITKNCQATEIVGNRVSGAGYIGIGTGDGAYSVIITDNRVYNCVDNAVDSGNSRNVTVQGNIMDGCLGGFVSDLTGLSGPVIASLNISGNQVFNAVQSGILLLAPTSLARGFAIVGNIVELPGEHGICVSQFRNGTIIGNTVRKPGENPVGLWSGIRLADDTGGCQQVIVIGNAVTEDGRTPRAVGIDKGNGGSGGSDNNWNVYVGNEAHECSVPYGGTAGANDFALEKDQIQLDSITLTNVTGALVVNALISATELFTAGKSSAGSFASASNGAVGIFFHSGDPNGAVTANPGSRSLDTSPGRPWTKMTGTGSTGWTQDT